ncbi:MAG: thiamine ABC transporter substrate-binding protein [Ancrocorticia sp.]|uniref:thiamine ABC transporter substrate-binding protein n=1 Tax=Ancrocorticia sp. TaxID=2593684 RepID=UPI003F9347EC
MKQQKIAATAVAALALGGLAACSGDDSQGGDAGSAPDSVTVLVHDSFNVPQDLIDRFEEESGFELTTTAPGDAGVVVNQLILAKDNPTVDAVYGVENFSVQKAVDEGVFANYTSGDLPASGADYTLDGAVTPIDLGDVCVNVDHAWFEEQGMDEPATFDDLAKPEYAELLVVQDPAASSPGLAFLVGTVEALGEDSYLDYWQSLLDGGTKVASGWSDAYYSDFSGAEGEGDYPLVVSYASSPAESAGATGSLDDTCVRQIEYAGVVEGAANPEGAQAFIDFMLSDDVQAAIPGEMYMYPINDQVELPEEWAEYAAAPENPIEADTAVVAENRDTWIKDWTALYEESGN